MKSSKVETVNSRFDLVALGECLVELRREAPGRYSQSYAGDVFNTLYYASRLSLRTGFISQFGSDVFTRGLISLCGKEHIDISLCKTHSFRANGIYMIRTEEGQPTFSFWRKGSAATMMLVENDPAALADYVQRSNNFLFSAIGLAVFQDIEKLYELLSRVKGKVKIHFDMNVRPALWEDIHVLRQHVERLVSIVDVIFVSSGDDQAVFGERTSQDAIAWFKEAGYPCVIYRDGASATIGWSAIEGFVEVPAVENVTVVDATGAGDAFNAGFISVEGSFEDKVREGNRCGALAVQGIGGRVRDF